MKYDIFHDAVVLQAFDPDTVTADALSEAIDMLGYKSLTVIVGLGATGDTIDADNHAVHKVTECAASGGTYTAVARGHINSEIASGTAGEISLFNNVTHSADEAVHATVHPTKRYVKVAIDVTGTWTNGTPCYIAVLRHDKGYLPANT